MAVILLMSAGLLVAVLAGCGSSDSDGGDAASVVSNDAAADPEDASAGAPEPESADEEAEPASPTTTVAMAEQSSASDDDPATAQDGTTDEPDDPEAVEEPTDDDPADESTADDGSTSQDEPEVVMFPGEGIDVIAGRGIVVPADHFLAEIYERLLTELGFSVSNPADLELYPSDGHSAIASAEMSYWPNSWQPWHSTFLADELPDGSLVGDHVDIVGEVAIIPQGFVISRSFADEFAVYAMDDLNSSAAAIAAFDATDPIPGNGVVDIFGCAEAWTCGDVITNQIAFSGWENIQQVAGDFEAMRDQAIASANSGVPMVAYTTVQLFSLIAELTPGDDVYWLGVDQVLDDSNPAGLTNGELHSQRGEDGSGGFAALGADQCPAAADNADGLCPLGWISPTIRVAANSDFLAANPAARVLFETVTLSPVDIAYAEAQWYGGVPLSDSATDWIADNRALVDDWLTTARSAA